MSQGRVAILVALITGLTTISVALIDKDYFSSSGTERHPEPESAGTAPLPEPEVIACSPIPLIEDENIGNARPGYAWQPTDYDLDASGNFVLKRGKWVRVQEGESTSYVRGHWNINSGACEWISGSFN